MSRTTAFRPARRPLPEILASFGIRPGPDLEARVVELAAFYVAEFDSLARFDQSLSEPREGQ
jgi:hypothetical protein